MFLSGRTSSVECTFCTSMAHLFSRGDMAMPKHQELHRVFDQAISLGLPQLFSTADESGDVFKGYRKGLAPSFSIENLKKSFPKVRATLDIIGHVGFNYEFKALDSEGNKFVEAFHENLVELWQSLADPIGTIMAKLFPTAKAKQSKARKEHLKALYTEAYEALKSRGEPPAEDQSIGANLMRIKKPSTGEPFPEEVVFANFIMTLVAGYDTTAITCMWALYDIARHPDAQRRIAQELAGAGLLQVPSQAHGRQLEWADLAAFPYFNAVLKESMRLHTVVASGAFRQAPKDVMLGGWHIPKGSVVWIPLHAVSNSIHNFTKPEVFDPERWLGELPTGGKPTPAANTAHRDTTDSAASHPTFKPSFATPHGHANVAPSKATVPFGDGSRGCMGMNLAYVDMRTILLSILSKFWLELDPSVGSHEKVEAAQVMGLVMGSGIPIKLRLKSHVPL
ncbi:cytochrome P450 [Dunaliella salina]|uniref:Cytochrome P450 n=1 Tax=Dunaliella salina TaxID=3046 RepID=A0ABQ7GBT2_DUNSA|nr:cytochrome P450 [Dunaliella salina]|eukprot:KAF5832072.1 cytochrome P450 [Dunaliella salina]